MRASAIVAALTAVVLARPALAEEGDRGEATAAAHVGVRMPFVGDTEYGDALAGYGFGGLSPALVLDGEGGYRVTDYVEVGGSLSYLYCSSGGPIWAVDNASIAHHALEPVGFARLVYRDDDLLFGASLELGTQLLFAAGAGEVDPAGSFILRPSILFGAEYLEMRVGYAAALPGGFDHPRIGGLYGLVGFGGVI
ncbi:MAG: hypothetical protein JRI23_28240 [Deltaproteobacteria bacterium]|jgi:hypothetical protein|nr:hypothetical protein [Deltaproteobacteria bacterium]MBW2535982.1 hypothetical protein [Deltaproteobacteria bacterium]